MANVNVKFTRTTSAKLDTVPIVEGQIIYVSDTGAHYFDKDSETRIQMSISDEERTDWNAAYEYSQEIHAPADAEKNIIVGVKQNGTDLVPDSDRKINITVPTQPSDIGAGTYTKPADGIPKTDLDSSVQASLGKADTALQSFTETDPTVPSHVKSITSEDIAYWNDKANMSDIPTSLPASDVKEWAKADKKPTYTASEVGALASTVTHLSGDIAATEKGAASGVATLGTDGKIPSSQLPSYVDDVLEYSAKASFPKTGESGKIYVDTSNNKTYRWSGTTYVEISPSIVIGTTTGTALDGKVGNDHITDGDIHVTEEEKTAWTNKQNALTAQTAYSKKGSATKVPQITTNALGQTTSITEVNIAFPPTLYVSETEPTNAKENDVWLIVS